MKKFILTVLKITASKVPFANRFINEMVQTIINEYEFVTLVRVTLHGEIYATYTLKEIREMNGKKGFPPSLTINIGDLP